MKEKLRVEKYGGSLILKINKYFKEKHNVKEGEELEVNFGERRTLMGEK